MTTLQQRNALQKTLATLTRQRASTERAAYRHAPAAKAARPRSIDFLIEHYLTKLEKLC